MRQRSQIVMFAVIGALLIGAALVHCAPGEHVVHDGRFILIYELASIDPVSETQSEYTFRGRITTTNGFETGVKAVVASTDPASEIIDAFLMFPGAVNRSFTDSVDTFTIRQDGTMPFDPSSLNWTIFALILPEDPGDAGDNTIEGIDSDQDGVRDDLQRYIELSEPESARTREAATQFAVVLQQAIADGGVAGQSQTLGKALSRSIYCVDEMLATTLPDYSERAPRRRQMNLDLERLAANTDDRAKQYLGFSSSLSGTVDDTQQLGSDADCDFDPSALPD